MKEIITKYFPAVLLGIGLLMLPFTPTRTPPETVPPTTEQTVPETTVPPDALPLVEEILEAFPLSETAAAHCIYDDTLHSADGLTGAGSASPAHALARLCDDRKMNPIAAFWLLKEEGLYRKSPELNLELAVPAFYTPEIEPKAYPYTAEGIRGFLTELLTLSADLEDSLLLDERVLGTDASVEQNQVFLEQKDCYYAYYICYDDEAAHFLCFYLRGGETITDVEFQLLNLRYAKGESEALTRIDQLGDRQASALMAAAELLMTGSSRAAEGRIPFGYALEGCTMTLERIPLSGSVDTGALINYRIQK